MLFCPSCKTECPDNANFCLQCGTSLKLTTYKATVSSLSEDNMTTALKRLMPTSYVEKLLASKGKMEGERRVVTILFSDVKGSTALAENLDPEEVLEVMNGAFSVLIEPITRYEGTLARLMGDAILAFFGAPIAHEDDPYRAGRAAIEILEGANKFSKKLELEKGIQGFGVRVGINTGLVVVAEVGTDFRVEYTAMGDAVNTAARMESSAEPGTILITEATKKLIEKDFELKFIGPIQVKGKSEPINTYRILNIKKSETFEDIIKRFHSPLIGRNQELRKLREVINGLSSGRGGIVSIIGESGIGKSRLVAELRKQFSTLNWAETRALTYTVNKSYWMFQGLMKNFLGFSQESNDSNIGEVLYKKINDVFKENSEEILPYYEYFLKTSVNKSYTEVNQFSDLGAVQGQFHHYVKEFFKRESLKRPIVLSWEDLQWCDLSSMELLIDLLSLSKVSPIILLLQYRLDENEKRVWNFYNNSLNEYEEIHDIVQLHPLSDDESTMLIENLLGNQKLIPEIKNQVIIKAEGNPAFIEEVIHSIIEKIDSGANINSPADLSIKSDFHVSGLLQNVIMSRYDCLEPLDKIVLQTASVIGRVFQKNILIKVLLDSITALEIENSLKQLQCREFVLRHLPVNINSGITKLQKEYIFKQDIAQNVIYNSILITQRQNLHKRIAEEMENLCYDDVIKNADSLAFHFEKGKVFAKAFDYYKVAAKRAREFYANDNAVYFYSKLLELAKNIQADSTELAYINESLGDVYLLKAEYSLALDHFNSALEYINVSDDLARIHYKCGQICERWGNYEKALEYFNSGLHLISDKDTNKTVSQIYIGLGMVYFRQENITEALKYTEKALVILEKIDNDSSLADVYNNLGIIYSKSEDLEKSLEYHQKSLEIRKRIGLSRGVAASSNNLGYVHQLNNNLEQAKEYYLKSIELSEKIGDLHNLARTYDNLSHVYIMLGDNELATEYNLKAISIVGRIARGSSSINADVWLQSGVW